VQIAGQALPMIAMPVLAKRKSKGEIITAGDLTLLEVRADRLAVDTVSNEEGLIGKQAKRSLLPLAPVREADLTSPIAVSRGSLVTMIYQNASLTLTAQGKALEDGSMGEVIRISNSKSERVIEGVVSGPNRIIIKTGTDFAFN
jgi:flagellar basal body P-ring formation protein FlgA